MLLVKTCVVVAVLLVSQTSHAATILFNTDPFEGTNASDPGRQIVGGPGTPFTFDIAVDQFLFDPDVFGIDEILFHNSLSSAVPATGVNVEVVQDGPPLAAGVAATRIADQVTSPGPGFFIYFNTGLDLPRLVFSKDLSDPTADLAILARLTNLSGGAGFALLPTFTEDNFAIAQVPEPATMSLLGVVIAGIAARRLRRRSA
jgi:hypothetical protein